MDSYENLFAELKHYKKYPKMLPWVGKNYNSQQHKKLLVVGESHYFPTDSINNMDAEKWYGNTNVELNADELSWIFTRNLVEYATECNFKNRGFSTYQRIHQALHEAGLISNVMCGNNQFLFNEISYMNYFQRPACKGQSIKDILHKLDLEIAYENFTSVIEIIKPDLIIFASKFSIDSAEKYELWKLTNSMGTYYTYVNHPSTAWWNKPARKSFFKGRTSREHFCDFLKLNNFLIK